MEVQAKLSLQGWKHIRSSPLDIPGVFNKPGCQRLSQNTASPRYHPNIASSLCFKMLSRIQLIFEFRPWLEYTRDHLPRRLDSPFLPLWDCFSFGAPLNTLLELLGSPTPRHMVVSAEYFDGRLQEVFRQLYRLRSCARRARAIIMWRSACG